MPEIILPESAEWFEHRVGRVTASRVYDATCKLKSGAWSSKRADYMTELACERLTGQVTRHFVTAAMQDGIDREPDARAAYEYLLDVDVAVAGFRQHPEIHQAGATPDGAIGSDGLLELKCPTPTTHVETILTKVIDPKYCAQIAWQLACFPERQWVDFGTYAPSFPPELRLWVFRYTREAHAKYIAQLEADVRLFLAELDEMVSNLIATGRMEKAA
jgi:hypothetical protein